MATSATTVSSGASSRRGGLLRKLNRQWHEPALKIFMAIVLAHWGEHLFQAYQVYALGWPVPESLGMLGMWFPSLVASEALHYGYALIMVVALWILRDGFVGRSYTWWMISFGIQFWHHFEHLLLQGQAIAGQNLFNAPVPVSIVQLWVPRVELHLIYNTLVFIPMVVAMYYHMFPVSEKDVHPHCTCAIQPRPAAA